MELSDVQDDLSEVLFTPEQIDDKIAELAAAVDRDYAGNDPLLVGVLKGAVMVMADFSRHLTMQAKMDWMAVSSYGSGTKSSGVVRILKDLDTDLHGRDVIIVEDIIDSGLTLSWLKQNLAVPRCRERRDRRPAAQARGRQGRGRRQVRRLRHPRRLRGRLRPRLRRALPQPARHRRPGPARLLVAARRRVALGRPARVSSPAEDTHSRHRIAAVC